MGGQSLTWGKGDEDKIVWPGCEISSPPGWPGPPGGGGRVPGTTRMHLPLSPFLYPLQAGYPIPTWEGTKPRRRTGTRREMWRSWIVALGMAFRVHKLEKQHIQVEGKPAGQVHARETVGASLYYSFRL